MKDNDNNLVDGYAPIYRVKTDASMFGITQQDAICQDLAEEYAICADDKANAGLIVYGKHNGVWVHNPWSTRFLIRHLLEKLGIGINSLPSYPRPLPPPPPIPPPDRIRKEGENPLPPPPKIPGPNKVYNP